MFESPAVLERELSHALAVLALLALRVAPALVALAASIAAPWLGALLGLALAVALCPLALGNAPRELLLGSQLWAAGARELARGLVLGLGVWLPLAACGWSGRFAEAYRTSSAGDVPGPQRGRVEGPPPLAALFAGGALAVLFASGAHLLVFRALLSSLSDVPLGGAAGSPQAAQSVLLELAGLIARAFSLAFALSTPVLLCVASVALALGLVARIAGSIGASVVRGPLLAWLGLSAACFTISSILGELPPALRVFVDRTLALLRGLG
jgi:flagellar biosynthesis protein FliR